MAGLEEQWGQVTASDRYKGLDAEDKEKVRRNFYRKKVISNPKYQDLPEERRYAIRQDFDKRTKPRPEPGLMDQAKLAARMLPVAVDTLEQGPLGKARQALSDIPIPGAETLQKKAHGLSETAMAPGAINPSEESLEQTARKTGSISTFQKARMYAAGAVSTLWEFAAEAIPKDVGSLAQYIVLNKALEIGGATRLGKWDIAKAFDKSAKPPLPTTDSPFGKSVLKATLEENGRTDMGGPQPLETQASADESARLEEWLANHPGDQQVPQEDIHPNPKVNQSQLREHQKSVREAVAKRLQALKDEPGRLSTVAREEDFLRGYYTNKFGNMVILGQPGPALPKQELLPAGPERVLLEAPKTEAAVKKTPKPETEQPADTGEDYLKKWKPTVNSKNIKLYVFSKLKERHPNETRQTLNALTGTITNTLAEQVGLESANLGPIADHLIDQGASDHILSQESIRQVPTKKGFLSREESARLKAQGISHDEVLAEAERLKQEWDYRNMEPEGHRYIRELGGIAPHKPDIEGKVDLQEEYAENVKGSLRGSRPADEIAQNMYEEGYLDSPSEAALHKYLSENAEKTGKPRSVKSFISEAIHNLEAPLTPPEDFSLESVKARPYDPVQEPVDNTQRSMFDIAKEVGEHFLDNERGAIGPGKPIDPVEYARMEENVKELVRRARAIGYKTAEDIMLYAAKNAPKEYQKYFSSQLTASTLSPWDTHSAKETEAAMNGNKVAQKSIKDRAWYDYLLERMGQGTYKARSVSRQLARFKDGDEGLMRMKFLFFKNDVLRDSKIPKIEREALRFYMEKDVPDVEKLKVFRPQDAEELVRLAKNPTPAMVEAARQIRPYEDEWYNLFSEHYDDVAYVQDYAMRRWKKADDFVTWESRTSGSRSPWLKGRKLTSAAQGINAGFEPHSFDIRDDLQVESDMRTALLSKLHTLKKVALSMDDKMNPSLIIDSDHPPFPGTVGASKRQITPFAMKKPEGFLTSDHPLLRGLAFNPDYKPLMDYMFKSRARDSFLGIPMRMIEGYNAISKKSIFMYSLFHPWALTEMLTAGSSMREMLTLNPERNIIWRTLAGIRRGAAANLSDQVTWKHPIRDAHAFYTSFMEGHAALAKRSLALDSAEHSLTFSAIDDVQKDIFNRTLVNMEGWLEAHKSAPVAKGIKILRGANEIFDKALWDYWAPMIKMTLYENHLADNMKTFGGQMSTEEIKIQTATFINKAVGGQAWGDLLASPKTQQAMQWLMLAPDWTIGRVLMGSAALTSGPQGRQARKLLARGFLAVFVFGNMMNYINSQKYGLSDKNGKPGRFMWDNDPGREMDIVWGKEGDRTIYMTPSKAFTELYQDLFYPKDTARHKVSPLVNTVAAAVTGYGSGGIPVKGPLDMAGRLVVPLSARGGNIFATFPKHKGMSAYQAEQLFEKYERTGDEKAYNKAIQFSIENGLNWQGIHQHAKSVVRGERKREDLKSESGHLLR